MIVDATLEHIKPEGKFPLGRLLATPGALRAFTEAGENALDYLLRHVGGDWGDVPPEDAKENEFSLTRHLRLFSAYTLDSGIEIWVITEADRSATTILLPSEY